MAHFNAAPVIAANARNKGTRKHLKSVYYDTPERTLRRNGLSLRVRQSGARFVQTVKTDAVDDPLRRGEWEASVPSLAPDLALAMPFIPEKLRSHLEAQPLEAVFTADVHRHARMIELPSGTVEIAFDQGELTAGDRSLPVSEIELELKSGSASAIYEIALRLAEHGDVKPSIRTKSARGFDLAADKPPSARRPRKLRLDPSVTLDEAFATILRSCFLHLLQSLPAAEDGRNPEGVHQLRVSLRRLRSVLDLMRSAGASAISIHCESKPNGWRKTSPPRATGTCSGSRPCRRSQRPVRRSRASMRWAGLRPGASPTPIARRMARSKIAAAPCS